MKPTTAVMPARRRGDALQRALVGLEERRVLDQVADAIAGQRQLGRDDDVGAPARGRVERAENLCGVAVDVPARGVHLSECDAHVLYSSISHQQDAGRDMERPRLRDLLLG